MTAKRTHWSSALTAVVLVASLGASGAAAGPAALHGQRITVGDITCAPNWHAPRPGLAHFAVHNESSRKATVLFFDAVTSAVIAEVSDVPAGGAAALTARVRAGRSYLWGCNLDGGVRHTSQPKRVRGNATHGGPGRYVPPTRVIQVRPALRSYRSYVHALINQLVPAVDRLRTELELRDLAAAESTWLAAHLVWLRIGQADSAYGVFGELGRRIDGTTAGYPRGLNDPTWTGFHRLEYDLWTKPDPAAAAADANTLASLVDRLTKVSLTEAIPGNVSGASGFVLRSHEILEDAVRDTLSGNDDYGSGTALASVIADVAATREVLRLLEPLIDRRSPGLVGAARHDLSRLESKAETGFHDGEWTAIAQLSPSQRAHINAAAGAADEELAPVPDLLRIGNT